MAQTENYSSIYDVEILQGLIGTDYANMNPLIASGAVEYDPTPVPSGTTALRVRNRLFESDDEGQTIGIGTSISDKVPQQTGILHPIINRADSAVLDDVQKDMMSGGAIGPEIIAGSVRAKASLMMGYSAIRALEGAFESADLTTALSFGTGAVISLTDLSSARFKRGDFAERFLNGIILLDSATYAKAISLGLVAFTSNTFGTDAQNALIRTGMLGTILGMTPVVSDVISANATNSTYNNVFILERGAIMLRGGGVPQLEILRKQSGFADIVRFRIAFSVGLRGIGWSGAVGDSYSNVELATGSNWSLKLENIKHVPAVRYVTNDV